MNWLRDNILKILIILGIAVIAIIIFAMVFRPKSDNVVSGTKYAELENKLQNAAIKYMGKHKKLLPSSTDKSTKVKLQTLISNNYIGKLVAVDDPTVKCDGYVLVNKIDEEKESYRYTPYISCGNYYTTKTIGDYIISLETQDGKFNRTVDAGLYKMGDEYVFRGESVNNFLMLGNHKYRIIKIEKDNTLKLISTGITQESYVWDDRYNIEKNDYIGINEFLKSRMHETLNRLYENTSEKYEIYFSNDEKNYIIEHDFCIGKRDINDTNFYSGVECKETIPLKVGLITVDEVAKASIDTNCKGIYDKSCSNYNYFFPNGLKKTYTTLTAASNNTYQNYIIKYEGVTSLAAIAEIPLYPVIYINNNALYASGTGTTTDPYVIR